MTDDNFSYDLSRRKTLAALGALGAAGAGAGMGTSAFFSDQETFTNNQLVAGELDMKMGYSAYYSDWKPDESGTEEDENVDVRMWEGPLNTTGGPGDLNDDEYGLPTNNAWLIAVSANNNTTDVDGDTDVDRDDAALTFLDNTEYASSGTASCGPGGTDADEFDQPVIDLEDVKPGDFGEVTFDFAICDNPGFVWLQGELLDANENGTTEPEEEDPDEEDNEVELLDVVQAAAWVDDGNNYQNGDETFQLVGSLRAVLTVLSSNGGLGLTGDIPAEDGGGAESARNCFSAETTHSVAFAWWVPVDHGNEIQSDSVTFELSFYTEQCRHNKGSEMTAAPVETPTDTPTGTPTDTPTGTPTDTPTGTPTETPTQTPTETPTPTPTPTDSGYNYGEGETLVKLDQDCTAGGVGEDEEEKENEDEGSSGGDYVYTYNYIYNYMKGDYNLEYEYNYVWSPSAKQDPDPPAPTVDESLPCSADGAGIGPDPSPNPNPP